MTTDPQNILPQVLHDCVETVLIDVLLQSTSMPRQKCHQWSKSLLNGAVPQLEVHEQGQGRLEEVVHLNINKPAHNKWQSIFLYSYGLLVCISVWTVHAVHSSDNWGADLTPLIWSQHLASFPRFSQYHQPPQHQEVTSWAGDLQLRPVNNIIVKEARKWKYLQIWKWAILW